MVISISVSLTTIIKAEKATPMIIACVKSKTTVAAIVIKNFAMPVLNL